MSLEERISVLETEAKEIPRLRKNYHSLNSRTHALYNDLLTKVERNATCIAENTTCIAHLVSDHKEMKEVVKGNTEAMHSLKEAFISWEATVGSAFKTTSINAKVIISTVGLFAVVLGIIINYGKL